MALKSRKAPQMSPNERAFVKKQALGQFITGRPPGRPRRPVNATSGLTAQLNKANGVQTGKRAG